MYESFGWIGIQLPEKYKENFDLYCYCLYTSYLTFADKYNLLNNKYYIFFNFYAFILSEFMVYVVLGMTVYKRSSTMYTNINSTSRSAFARNVEVLLVFFR
jgi:hypothetical protein